MGKQKYFTEEERKEARRASLRKSNAKYYQKNKEKVLEQQKEYKKQWYQDNKEKELERKKEYNNTPMGRAVYLVSSYKKADKQHNRGECTLTTQWIIDNIFSKPCHYNCGKKGWELIGCDRIDNGLPHTPDNVVPCCEECNNKRGRKTYEEFVEETMYK